MNPPPLLSPTLHEPGLFGSVLRAVDRPGQIVRNLLTGNVGAAGRHLGSLAGDIIDAPLPGDWIPEAARKDDFLSGAEMLGIEKTPWYVRVPLGLGVELATDPLTYVSFGTSKLAATGLKAAAKSKTAFSKAKLARSIAEEFGQRVGVMRKAIEEGAEATPKMLKQISDFGKMAGRHKRAASRFERAGKSLRKVADERPIASIGVPWSQTMQKNIPITRGAVKEFVKRATGTALEKLPIAAKDPAKAIGKQIATFTDNMMRKVREATGHLQLGAIDDARVQAEAAGWLVGGVEQTWMKNAMKGLRKGSKESKAIAQGMVRYSKGIGKDDAGKWIGLQAMEGNLEAAARAAAADLGADADKVLGYMEEITKQMPKSWKNLVETGAITGSGMENYWPLLFKGKGVNVLRKQRLKGAELADHLNQGVGELYDDAVDVLKLRIDQQETIVRKAVAVNKILGRGANITDQTVKSGMGDIITRLVKDDKDLAKGLKMLWSPAPKPGWFTKALMLNNKIFKPAATFGLGIPRLSFNTRNKLSSTLQTLAVEDMGWQGAWRALKTVPDDLYGSFVDGMKSLGLVSSRGGKGALLKNSKQMANRLQLLDEAYEAAEGSVAGFKEFLKRDPDLMKAVDLGVLDGFVSTEGMLKSFGEYGGPFMDNFNKFLSWPAAMTQGMESRMRLGAFLDLMKSGKGAREAAKLTREAMLDYSTLKGSGIYGMKMRQVIPFFAFTAQELPKQAKFLYRHPAAAVALAQFYSGSKNELVEPWIGEQASIPLGDSEQGKPLYATTFGLPHEVLNQLPQISGSLSDMGRDVRRSVIGSAHPLVKTAYSAVSGRDPFFGSKAFSYDKAPAILQKIGVPKQGKVGRLYNMAVGAGVIQPIHTPIQQMSRAVDPRMPWWARAMNLTTGARIYESDPARAKMQILQEQLETDPEARAYTKYYGGGEETQAKIRALRQAAKELKEQKEAAILK